MKKTFFYTAIFSFLFFAGIALGAEDKGQQSATNIPPGMEVIKVGKANVVVPKGTKIRRGGDVMFLENINEYSARKFSEIEDRLSKIEATLSELETAGESSKGAPSK